MFLSNRSGIRWFLIALSIVLLPIQSAICAPQGIITATIEWGTSTAATYTYVFSGVITCQNKPCSNARVDIDLVTTSHGVISRSIRAGDDGHYQLALMAQGEPEDSSTWKLAAHSDCVTDQESAEAEGRVILMEDQKTVVVDRSLLLIQA
jgi:hypothetical protein